MKPRLCDEHNLVEDYHMTASHRERGTAQLHYTERERRKQPGGGRMS